MLHFIIGQDHRHRHRFRSAGREHGIEFLFLSKDARFYIPQELVYNGYPRGTPFQRGVMILGYIFPKHLRSNVPKAIYAAGQKVVA